MEMGGVSEREVEDRILWRFKFIGLSKTLVY